MDSFLSGPPIITERDPLIAPASPPLTGESKKEIFLLTISSFEMIEFTSSTEVVE